MTHKIGEPFFAGDLVVYFTGEDEARVIDYDCRYEITTTSSTCECCTFRFRSRRDPGFICRHIDAVRKVKNGQAAG